MAYGIDAVNAGKNDEGHSVYWRVDPANHRRLSVQTYWNAGDYPRDVDQIISMEEWERMGAES